MATGSRTGSAHEDSLSRISGPVRAVPGIYFGLVLLVLALAVYNPVSVQPMNLLNTARQASALGVVAIGQTIVIVTGGLDLSVGSTMILVEVLAAQLMDKRPEFVLPVVVGLLALGVVIGAINGFLVTRLRVAPFVTTLGMNSILLGAALVVSGGAPRGNIPASMRFWGNGFFELNSIGIRIPASLVVLMAVFAVGLVYLRMTTLGRYTFAIGANPRAARIAGVNVSTITLLTYVVSGTLAAAGGLLLAAYIGVGTLTVGDDYMLNSIAAAVLGGTPFDGGRGTVVGTLGGAVFLYLLFGFLQQVTQEQSIRSIIQGLLIILIVVAYSRAKLGRA